MKKSYLLPLLFWLSISKITFGQSYLGGHFSTRDAILSNTINPAAGVASDMKWQVNLIGTSVGVGNNYFSLNGKLMDMIKHFDKDKFIGSV